MSEQDYRRVLDSLLDPLMIFAPVADVEGRLADLVCRQVNPAACDYLGVTDDELVGSQASADFPDDVLTRLLRWCTEVRRTGAPLALDGETIASLRDGSTRWIDIRITPVAEEFAVTWRDTTSRHTAAAHLAESEERFRILAENSTDVVLRTGPNGTIEWVSPSVTEILGYQPGDLLGRRMPDLMHPQDLQKLFVQMKDLQASGRQGGGFSARIRTATDRWLWMSGVGRVLTDDDGAIIGGIDALRDIQAEHNMSVALRESEAHFRLLALHSADVVAQLTTDGRFAWVSPSAEEMLHVPARSLLGRAVTEIVHPGDRAQLSAQLQATLDDSVSAPSTVRVETAGGDYRWVEASLHRIAPETPSSAAVVIRLRDVDEAVRAYRDLSRSERRFRTAMQSAPIGMAVSDLDDRITEANPALGLMLGHERSWLQHQRLTDIVDKRDVDTVVDMHDELFSGRIDAIRREVRLRRADDTPVWVDLALAIVRDDDWEPLSFVAQALDITASREARASLEYLADHDPLTGPRTAVPSSGSWRRRSTHAPTSAAGCACSMPTSTA